MNNANIIREYLVSLGFDVDNAAYQKFQQALKRVEQATSGSNSKILKNTAKVASAISLGLGAAVFATIKLAKKFADTDLEYKKFALHMYMGEAAAKRLKIAQEALGASLDDIAFIPELRKRYFELIKLQKQLESKIPDDKKQLKKIRDLEFQFKKLGIVGRYSVEQMITGGMRKLNPQVDAVMKRLEKLQIWLLKNKGKIVEAGAKVFSTLPTAGKVAAVGTAVAAGAAIATLAAKYGKKLFGTAAGVAEGKVLESVAGVQPVFVVNMPSGGMLDKVPDVLKTGAGGVAAGTTMAGGMLLGAATLAAIATTTTAVLAIMDARKGGNADNWINDLFNGAVDFRNKYAQKYENKTPVNQQESRQPPIVKNDIKVEVSGIPAAKVKVNGKEQYFPAGN